MKMLTIRNFRLILQKRCEDFGAEMRPIDQLYGRNRYQGICQMYVCGNGEKLVGY